MKSPRMLLCFSLWFTSLGARAFHSPTETQAKRFDRLYAEAVRFALSPKVLVSSEAFQELNGEAYRELELSGTEVLELIYKKVKDFGDGSLRFRSVSRAGVDMRNYSRLSLLYYLWNAIACQGRFQDQNFPWGEETIAKVWEGGAEIWDARTAHMLNEWREAREEGRINDVGLAKSVLVSLGLFSFSTLFNELQNGHDDVIELLKAVRWRSRWRKEVSVDPKAFDRQSLLDWWSANRAAYELPHQSPNFKGAADLWKWKRTGK